MDRLFERLLSPATMIKAEQEIIGMRSQAVPILRILLTGEAKYSAGVPYRDLGLSLRCALETALRLGADAKPLESLLRTELTNGEPVAARALGALGSLEPESVIALLRAIEEDWEVAFEAVAALIQCGQDKNELVHALVFQSERAAAIFAKVRNKLPKHTDQT